METAEELQRQYALAKRRVRRDILSTRAIEASLLAQQAGSVPSPLPLFSTRVEDHLQEFLLQFKYEEVLKELLDISQNALRSMSRELFTEIARAISQHRIDFVTAGRLFGAEGSEMRWERLARRTVHKMRLLFLTEKFCSSGVLALPSLANRRSSSITFLQDRTSLKKAPKKLSSVRKTTVGPRKHRPKREPSSEYLHSLTMGLARSGTNLRSIAGSQNEIMVVSAQTMPVSQYSAAAAFSRSIAVQRIQGLCLSRAKRLLSEAWAMLKAHARLFEVLNTVVIPAVKALAAKRLYQLFSRDRRRCAHRALLRLWAWIRVCRFNEYSAAAVELQRTCRGFLSRQKRKLRRLTTEIHTILRITRLGAIVKKMRFLWLARRSIGQIAAWYRRRKKLRLFYRRFFRRKCAKCAVIIQRFFRGSRSRRATKPLFDEDRQRVSSAIRVQSWMRGRMQRRMFNKFRKSVTVIQYAWCRHIRRKREAFRQIESTINLSRDIAKKSLLLRGEQMIKEAAAKKITAKLRKYAPKKAPKHQEDPWDCFFDHKKRFQRCLAAIRLRRLLNLVWFHRKQKREAAIIRRNAIILKGKRASAALEVQRVYRGFRGRRVADELRTDHIAAAERRYHNVPFYYRMQQSYLQTQNMVHRRQIMKIQTAFRVFLAKKLLRDYKRSAAAKIIALKFKAHKRVLDAKIVLLHKRAAYAHMVHSATTIQRIVRSWIARKIKNLFEAAKIILRFSLYNLRAKRVFGIVNDHKLRMLQQAIFLESVIKIQSFGRRYLVRVKYLKSHRKLVKAKVSREKVRRIRASVRIQTSVRCFLAKVRVTKRRAAFLLEQKKIAEDAAIEADLDAMHDKFLIDLQVVKVQQHVRKHQSAK